MTAGQVKSPAVRPLIPTSVGHCLPEDTCRALGCLCLHWGAAAWVPMAWTVLPDVTCAALPPPYYLQPSHYMGLRP